MLKEMFHQLKAAVILFVLLTLLTGLLYPLLITGVAQVLFPDRANGNLIRKGGVILGSRLIGQDFQDPAHFWGRPSATTPPYNAASSSGSNLGPSNPDLIKRIKDTVDRLRRAGGPSASPIPVDLVTASGSGLDPHISPAAALVQVPRVARARGLSEERVRELVRRSIEARQLGMLGEPRVSVLELNLALDGIEGKEEVR